MLHDALNRFVRDEAVMDAEADKAALLAVLEAETEAYLRRDFEALASHWVQSPQTRRMYALSSSSSGTFVHEGWDAIAAYVKGNMEHLPGPIAPERIHRERLNVTIGADLAWVSYDQVGSNANDKFEMVGVQHELKIFHRVEGVWKIACIVVMQRPDDPQNCPLIEVDPDANVVQMNAEAHAQIADHAALLVSGKKLRARNRSRGATLQEAIRWGHDELKLFTSPVNALRLSRTVILGENSGGAPDFCWVVLQHGKVFVSFNDDSMLERRIGMAREIFGFSVAQAQLALLIVKGQDLSQAAACLGVSINTVRTHLQRMFDRTGAHSQSALVGLLLSAEAPAAR